tara:strand:+ start:1646 stop:1819 length:174 start_codon:yes stop_codon:yes gene_type:complete
MLSLIKVVETLLLLRPINEMISGIKKSKLEGVNNLINVLKKDHRSRKPGIAIDPVSK